MNNKYYTPIPEEFHVGFEYEIRDSIELDYYKVISDGSEIGLIHKEIENNLIRVKYLNEKDIKSLGFESSPGNKFEPNTVDIKNYTKGRDKIMTYTTLENSFYTKLYILRRKNKSVLFEGTIKNISELKVLLKQLNINK